MDHSFVKLCENGDVETIRQNFKMFFDVSNDRIAFCDMQNNCFSFDDHTSDTLLYQGMEKACILGKMNVIEWLHDTYWDQHEYLVSMIIQKKKRSENYQEIKKYFPSSAIFQKIVGIALQSNQSDIANNVMYYELIE